MRMSQLTTSDDHKAVLNRQRVARCLLRQKAHIAIAATPYDGCVLDGLIQLGWLAEADDKNQQAINRALAGFLADCFNAHNLKNYLNGTDPR